MRDFGAVSAEDFALTSVEFEPDAEAVILFDKGKSYFSRGYSQAFDLVFERHLRIKILTTAGIRWAERQIPLHRQGVDVEVVDRLEAVTFNIENGAVTRSLLDPASAFDERLNEYTTVKKFAMPAVREGSILDITYRVVSPFVFRFHDWKFQSKIPTLYSFFEGRLIPFYEYVYILVGSPKLVLQKSFLGSDKYHFQGIDYNEAIYQFATKNVLSFDVEDYFTSEDDYIQRIDFQLSRVTQSNGQTREIITTWPKLVSTLEKDMSFGKYADRAEKAAKDLVIPGAENPDPEEKVKAIANYVKRNFSWNGYYGKYSDKNIKQVIEQKAGSAPDLNLMLVGLLRAHGLSANPVIISSRGNGKIYRDYPFESLFNYVLAVVTVNGKDVLIDATEANSAYDELPIRCFNDAGLMIKSGEERWVAIPPAAGSGAATKLAISFHAALDSINFSIVDDVSGYEAIRLRNQSENKSGKLEELYSTEGQVIKTVETENYPEPSRPFSVKLDGTLQAEKINGKTYFSPFLNAPLSEPMFKAPKRKYPIDLVYARHYSYESEVRLPDGHTLEAIPANYKIDNVLYSLIFNAEQIDATTYKFTGSFELKLPGYRPEHYAAIRMGSNKAVELLNQKIPVVAIN